MFNCHNKHVHPGFRPYQLQVKLPQQEHTTTISQPQQSLGDDPNRPHLKIKLDNNFEVEALIDSGSTICLGDASIIQHLKHQFPIAPPINVTDVHHGRKQTLGCYTACISVENLLPHPIKNRQINIHMQTNLSSKMVLDTDFLKNNGAIVDFKSNKIVFLPKNLQAISSSQKPIVCEAFASVVNQDIQLKDLETYNMATFAVQPTMDNDILVMD